VTNRSDFLQVSTCGLAFNEPMLMLIDEVIRPCHMIILRKRRNV